VRRPASATPLKRFPAQKKAWSVGRSVYAM